MLVRRGSATVPAVAHLETTGLAGVVAAGTVGIAAAVRAGCRELRLSWQQNGPNAVALGLFAAVPVCALVTAFVGTFREGLALGAACFVVGFVHGLDL